MFLRSTVSLVRPLLERVSQFIDHTASYMVYILHLMYLCTSARIREISPFFVILCNCLKRCMSCTASHTTLRESFLTVKRLVRILRLKALC